MCRNSVQKRVTERVTARVTACNWPRVTACITHPPFREGDMRTRFRCTVCCTVPMELKESIE
jgi:hypothetical protein